MISSLVGALFLFVAAPATGGNLVAQGAAASSPESLAFAAFEPLIGKTWRGPSITAPNIIDEVRFERVLGGQAIRSVHAINGGAYAGETLITWDPAQGRLVSFYATNGGFYTTGTIEVKGPAAFEFDQIVHGLEDISAVRATTTFQDDVYSIRSRHRIDGQWVETGGFDYRSAP